MVKEKFKCIKTYLLENKYIRVEIKKNFNLEFEFDGYYYITFIDNSSIPMPLELKMLPEEFNIYFKSLISLREDKLNYILNLI